jgi:iron complex outermembrane receptor protein
LDQHQLNLAYFNIDQRDFAQGNGKGDNGEAIYENAGKVKNTGFEVEMQGKIMPNWSYVANYTYLDQKLVKDQKPEYEGRRMWGVPHHQASLWTHYAFEEGILNGVALGLGYRYFGSTTMNYNTAQYNDVKIPSHGLWDASVAYDLQRLDSRLKGAKLQLNIQNLSNKRYVSSCANTGACWFGKARKVLLNMNYQW